MGMFDEVAFASGLLPPDLPSWATDPGHQWQTKDFEDPYLDKYAVTSDGRLVKDGQPIDFHGDLEVHTINSRAADSEGHYTTNGEPCEWLRLAVRFTHGRLERITVEEREGHPTRPYTDFLSRQRAEAARSAPVVVSAVEGERAVVDAVLYAMRCGCFFPVSEPDPKADTQAWVRWGALRNLHDKVATLSRPSPAAGGPAETPRG